MADFNLISCDFDSIALDDDDDDDDDDEEDDDDDDEEEEEDGADDDHACGPQAARHGVTRLLLFSTPPKKI